MKNGLPENAEDVEALIADFDKTTANMSDEARVEFLEGQLRHYANKYEEITGFPAAMVQRMKQFFELYNKIYDSPDQKAIEESLEMPIQLINGSVELIYDLLMADKEFAELDHASQIRIATGVALHVGVQWKEYLHG